MLESSLGQHHWISAIRKALWWASLITTPFALLLLQQASSIWLFLAALCWAILPSVEVQPRGSSESPSRCRTGYRVALHVVIAVCLAMWVLEVMLGLEPNCLGFSCLWGKAAHLTAEQYRLSDIMLLGGLYGSSYLTSSIMSADILTRVAASFRDISPTETQHFDSTIASLRKENQQYSCSCFSRQRSHRGYAGVDRLGQDDDQEEAGFTAPVAASGAVFEIESDDLVELGAQEIEMQPQSGPSRVVVEAAEDI